MLTIGIVTGLLAAVLQSTCYVISGSFVRRTGKPGWSLTAPQQALMALPYLLLAWFCRPQSLNGLWRETLPILALFVVGAFCGNTGLFQMQKTVEPSRASPLQSVKIPMIAFISWLILGKSFGALQIAAVSLIGFSAWLLGGAGSRIRFSGWAWLWICTLGYATSDLSIVKVIELSSSRIDSVFVNSLFALGLTHGVAALVNLPALIIQQHSGAPIPSGMEWLRYVALYGFTWMAAMIFLFIAFSTIGVVLGAMVQSTRAVISVFFGWVLARHGFADVEEKVSSATFFRRIFAALVIMLAIILYSVK